MGRREVPKTKRVLRPAVDDADDDEGENDCEDKDDEWVDKMIRG